MSDVGRKEALLIIERLCKRFAFSDSAAIIAAHMMINQEPLTIDDIAQMTELSRTSVSTALSNLEDRYLITKQKKGRIGFYSLTMDVGELTARQPSTVLENDIKPLISILEQMQRRKQAKYTYLLDKLKTSAATLEKMIKCLEQ